MIGLDDVDHAAVVAAEIAKRMLKDEELTEGQHEAMKHGIDLVTREVYECLNRKLESMFLAQGGSNE